MTSSRVLRIAATLSTAVVALAACGDDSGDASAEDAGLSIVASTNVYGEVAAAVAGDLASVTSIVTSPTQDPHEYEASAQDRLAIDGADVVIENGGGFDPFVDTLLDGGNGDALLLNAVEISGLAPDAEGFNEHVWYDFHTIEKLAEELSTELGELDPDNASTYQDNVEAFAAQIENLEAEAERLHEAAEGRRAMVTEPLPHYLMAELGLEDLTPPEFSEAVEEGADVPPRVLQETLDLFVDEDISVLFYNSQTEDATTQQVREAAEEAGVPIVEVSETLPEGQSYVEWQQSNLDSLAEVLG